MQLARNIWIVRKRWRMNQDEFASLLGLNRGNISNYERGQNTPDVVFLVKLQDLTGVNAKDLCYSSLEAETIPIQPLDGKSGAAASPPEFEEPNSAYSPESRLYNIVELVKRVELLTKKIELLESELEELKRQGS
jgi:transcriptional regulator with XRE-family HTH domain